MSIAARYPACAVAAKLALVWRAFLTNLSIRCLLRSHVNRRRSVKKRASLYPRFLGLSAANAALILLKRSNAISNYIKRGLSAPFYIIRHRASFPQSSIIAAEELNFCVRDGNRCFLLAMDTDRYETNYVFLIARRQSRVLLSAEPSSLLFSFISEGRCSFDTYLFKFQRVVHKKRRLIGVVYF